VRRRVACAALLALVPLTARAERVESRMGRLRVIADTALARPGGILVVELRMSGRLGTAYAIFEGRRSPVFWGPAGLRALVPIPATTPAGSAQLGIEVMARRGVQRLQMRFEVAERVFGERALRLSETKLALLEDPAGLRDGRRLMQAVRVMTPRLLFAGPFRSPTPVPPSQSYGMRVASTGPIPVETRMDGGLGSHHRGLDYAVAPGSLVLAPAAGAVVFAGPLLLTGQTLVIDHGQGLVSALCHLARLDVVAGESLMQGAVVGVSGDSGIAERPHVHWAVYLHGIPVDPEVVMTLFGS
jgi:murein DD-endopeptidase MepM/ murein hydrolase activator NlpD